jgi:hypothetical protein
MALTSKRLSELATDPALQGDELLYLAQDGKPYQVTLAAVAAHVGATLDYEPADEAILKATDIGTGPGTVAAGDHDHAGVYEPADEAILKATDIGTEPGSVAAGDHHHGGDAASLGSGFAAAGRVLMATGAGGAAWEVMTRIAVAATAPENPDLNDLWLDIS